MLTGLQKSFNESLQNEKQNVAEHCEHPPFHFDYIDSDVPNAIAFRYEGFSFIGMTMALITLLWNVCATLSQPDLISSLVGLSIPSAEWNRVHFVLFRTLLNFVVAHEYTHHVHGHVCIRESRTAFFSEVLVCSQCRGLDEQILEADADGYAAYHVLANLIDSGDRAHSIRLLNLEGAPVANQDEALLSCFVVAVAAYLLVRRASALDASTIYLFEHPPQAARMNLLMQQAMSWCKQNRPELGASMTLDRFQSLMNGVAQATWGIHGRMDWAEQTAFLRTEEGAEYFRKLGAGLKAHVESLSSARSSSL